MSELAISLRSTVGKKWLVGIGGLAWAGFCLMHMAGNLLLLVGPDAYNTYAYKLTSTPLIYLAEGGLIAFFLMHVGLGLQLTVRNMGAREQRYVKLASGPKRTGLIQRTLALSGLLILVFLVLHLITFKFGSEYTTEVGGVQMRDLYRLVNEKFHDPLYVSWYVVAVVVLGMHLSHGTKAAFQSLGVLSARNSTLNWFSRAFALIVTAGFLAQPLYLFFYGAQ